MNAKTLIRENIKEAAFQAFENISTQWNLSDTEKCSLLGYTSDNTKGVWQKDETIELLDADRLQRISHIIGIHKALHRLLPSEQAANEWVHQPNNDPMFNGRSALSHLLTGNPSAFTILRTYLDAQCQ